MFTRKTAVMFSLSVPFSLLTANAAVIMPDFGGVPAGWTTDRYEPASFTNVGTYQGRSDVLGIGITSAGNSGQPTGRPARLVLQHPGPSARIDRRRRFGDFSGSLHSRGMGVRYRWQCPD